MIPQEHHQSRIAIVNRGDAALRLIRAVHEYNLEFETSLHTIAFVTDAERHATFAREADEVHVLGPATIQGVDGVRRMSYLDEDVLGAALVATRADAVWVGWGFVSEQPEFAELCARLGVRLIGPTAATMRLLGDKIGAKTLAESADVPVVPWSGGPVPDHSVAAGMAEKIGYPLMVKAAAGGGGRGIRRVDHPADLSEAFDSAQREALSAFGDGSLFLEGAVEGARHVEVQVAVDANGTVWALGVRDCSVQRRRQKIVEESGIPGAAPEVVEEIKAAAARLIVSCDYVGLATAEFLMDADGFYFMEVNTRLQVEHTVTEEVTGLDLVKLQLELGFGTTLGGEPPSAVGYAIEARVTAEDPLEGFRPSPGTIVHWRPALGPGLRMDAGLAAGDAMPAEYDPLVAKIIARGRHRAEALARLRRGVAESRFVIENGATTLGFLRELLAHPRLIAGGAHTDFVDELVENGTAVGEGRADVAVAYVAVVLCQMQWDAHETHLLETARRGRAEILAVAPHDVEIRYGDASYRFSVRRLAADLYEVRTPDGLFIVETISRSAGEHVVQVGAERWTLSLLTTPDTIQVTLAGNTYRISHGAQGVVTSPLPAVVLDLRVGVGDRVEAGDVLAVLESMKLETPLSATHPGVVREVFVPVNAQIGAGDKLMRIDESESGGVEDLDGRIRFDRLLDAPPTESLVHDALRRLLGYDGRTPLSGNEIDILVNDADLESQVEVLVRFGRCASVTGQRQFSDDIHRPIRARDALARVLSAPGRASESVPEDFLDELLGALRALSPSHLDEPLTDDALFRLARAGASLAEIEQVVIAVVRRWLQDPDLQRALVGGFDIAMIERVALACEATVPVVSDLVWAALHHIWLTSHEPGDDASPAREARQESPGGSQGLDELDPDTADRLELWRFSNFTIEHINSRGDVHLLGLTARDHAADHRLVAIAGIPEDEATVRGIENVMLQAFAQIREHQAFVPVGRRSMLNRVVLYVDGMWRVTSEELQQATRRLAQSARNLGIERVIVRVSLPQEDGTSRSQVLHLTGPAERGLMLGMTDPSDEPLRTMSPRQQKVLKLRRRGLSDPYDIVDIMIARDAAVSDFPPGTFRELDLDDAGKLVEVSRPSGQNSAGVVVGIITNFTDKYPDGMTRIALLGDPSHGLGALAEPECRRIEAALALAQTKGIPVEWFTVSSGAKISMTSGTENLDWTGRVLRRIVDCTQSGGEINIVLVGVNVGAQSYFDAEATMLMHTRGILVMTPNSSMVLTGKEALDFSGGVSAEDNLGIGGHDRVMGPNGQAQYWASTVPEACDVLFRYYDYAYVAPGEGRPRARHTADEPNRDIRTAPHPKVKGVDFSFIGEIFADAHNPGRNKPFDMRALMRAVVDHDHEPLERWGSLVGGEGAIVWDAHLGGLPVSMLGIESRPLARPGQPPTDGPGFWSAATLFPGSSKKLARAINAASGRRPVVVLANLAGFDGSPESLRRLQLEYGAELGRAVVNFRGPLVFCVVSRYHGGAFVVFSKALNDDMVVLALAGSRASVIGGSAAAAVVFGREVERRVSEDPRIVEAESSARQVGDIDRALRDVELEALRSSVRNQVRKELADEFDRVHSVDRALKVGSIDRIIEASQLRQELIETLERKLGGPWLTEGARAGLQLDPGSRSSVQTEREA